MRNQIRKGLAIQESYSQQDFDDDEKGYQEFQSMADHLHGKGYVQDAQDGAHVPFHNDKLQRTIKVDLTNNSWSHHGWSPRAGVPAAQHGSGQGLDQLKNHLK